jgi:hypothetical protein
MQNPAQLSGRLFAAFIGACNVAEKGVFPTQAWAAQLENLQRAKGHNVHAKNEGISGDTSSPTGYT